MAASKAVNAALIAANKKANIGEINGHVKVMYDRIVGERAVYAISDTIDIGGKLPKGARILDAKVKSASLGTTGIMDFGYAASEEPTPLEVADPNAFVVGADAGGQAVLQGPLSTNTSVGKKLLSAVQPQIVFTEATTAATDVVIEAWIAYIVD